MRWAIGGLFWLFFCAQALAQAQVTIANPFQYPPGSTPVIASNTGTTAAATATLSAVPNATNYVCGINASASATSGTVVAGSGTGIAGTVSNNIFMIIPVLTSPAVGQVVETFTPCIPATGPNTQIQLVGPAPGSGGNSTMTIWGYYK